MKNKIVEKLKVENFDLTKKINIGTQVLEVGILDSKDNSGFTLTIRQVTIGENSLWSLKSMQL